MDECFQKVTAVLINLQNLLCVLQANICSVINNLFRWVAPQKNTLAALYAILLMHCLKSLWKSVKSERRSAINPAGEQTKIRHESGQTETLCCLKIWFTSAFAMWFWRYRPKVQKIWNIITWYKITRLNKYATFTVFSFKTNKNNN